MTLMIRSVAGHGALLLFLSGRMEAQYLAELRALCADQDRDIILNLEDVKLVDRDTVRFLMECGEKGIRLEGCPAYIGEWIAREREGG